MQRRFGLGRGRSAYWQHRHYKNFRKIASNCLQCGFEVTDFVVRSFDLLKKNHQYITPKDLTDPKLVEAYRKHVQEYGHEMRRNHSTQVQQLTDLETRLVPHKFASEEAILLDVDLAFDPWFRVLHPAKFSEAIFLVYGQMAWSELSVSQKLRDYARSHYAVNFQELERRLGKFHSLTGDNVG